jgi:hypothetical protein
MASRQGARGATTEAESVVDEEFEDEAFEDDEVVEEDEALDEIDELEELDEEFEDDEVVDLVLGVDDDAEVLVAADDDDEDDDVVEDEVLEDELDDDDDDEEILGFGEKALANDELLDFVDDTKEDLGIATVPIGEGEFTCRSCFIVKRRSQLADEKKMICFDCA